MKLDLFMLIDDLNSLKEEDVYQSFELYSRAYFIRNDFNMAEQKTILESLDLQNLGPCKAKFLLSILSVGTYDKNREIYDVLKLCSETGELGIDSVILETRSDTQNKLQCNDFGNQLSERHEIK